jgi:hypothetical protein
MSASERLGGVGTSRLSIALRIVTSRHWLVLAFERVADFEDFDLNPSAW